MEIWREAREGLSALRESVWPPRAEARGVERTFQGPEATVAAAWFATTTLLVVYNRARIDAWWIYALINLGLVTAILLVSRYVQRCSIRAGNWIRLGQTVVLILCAYSEVGYVIDGINPAVRDDLLIAIDRWLFGVDPTVWASAYLHPVAVEIFQYTYATYYFLPVALGALFIRRRMDREFDVTALAIVLAFYSSYLGYYLVPAVGPRFTLHEGLPEGLWGFHTVYHVLNSLEPTKKDCFPSGHTLVTLVVLYHAWRYVPRTLVWFAPLGLGILVSTVYLRYHYVVDVLAGAVLSVAICWAAPRLIDLLGDARRAGERRDHSARL